METETLGASKRGTLHKYLYALFWVLFCLSGIQPLDRMVWVFNGLVPFGIAALLFLFRKRYLPSRPTALLLFLQGSLLLLGAHFSFHQIPLMRMTLTDGTTRSMVDWVVHFVDGLVYAAVLSDLRCMPGRICAWLKSSHWLSRSNHSFSTLVLLFSLGLSLLWEMTEWVALMASGNRFLKNGGVMADTLIDVVLTVMGSMAALLVILSRRPRRKDES